MKTLRFLAMAMAAIWFVSFLGTLSSGAPPRGGPPKGNKPDVYSVLQVLQVGQDPSDASDIRVIRKSDVKIEEKRIKDEDAQYKKDYDEAKKTPTRPRVRLSLHPRTRTSRPQCWQANRRFEPTAYQTQGQGSCGLVQVHPGCPGIGGQVPREGVPDPKSTKKPAAS